MTEPRAPRPDDDPEVDAPVIAAHLAVPPAPPALVDAHVEAALAAFDEVQGDTQATVSDLTGRRTEIPWYRRVPLGAVAAAAIIVALVGASQLVGGDERDDETATARLEAADEAAPEESADDSASAFETGGAGDDATAPDADGRPAFASTDELVAHLDEVLAGDLAERSTAPAAAGDGGEPQAEADSPTPATTDSCDPVAIGEVPPDSVVVLEAVVLEGRPVTAVVQSLDDGHRLVVVDDETCQVVEDRAF